MNNNNKFNTLRSRNDYIFLSPATEVEVEGPVNSICVSKSAAMDGISGRIIKECAEHYNSHYGLCY